MNSLIRQLQQTGFRFTEILRRNTLRNSLQNVEATCGLHTTASLAAAWNRNSKGPRKWLQYNKIIYPPRQPDEEPRKAVSQVERLIV